MSVTLTELQLLAPSQPALVPSEVRDVDQADVEELPRDQGHTEVEGLTFAEASYMRQRPSSGPLTATRVEDDCIVSDLLGAVYGAGASYDEARANYMDALDAHLVFLRAREGVLHPRLRRELEVLTRLFPGR